MTSRTKKSLEGLKSLLPKVEKLKLEIAAKRDELRAIVEDVEAIVSSVDTAVDCLETGCREFNEAIESISQHL